jgi:hypothetical protein
MLTENQSNGYTVSFEGWPEDFGNADEAMNAFAFGLSDEARLREYRRGGFFTSGLSNHGKTEHGSSKARQAYSSFHSG